ncbi:MAG: NADH-quinone oxidoreductase subunit C [Bdellovibrionia bacterium]
MDKTLLLKTLNKALPGVVLDSQAFGRTEIPSLWIELNSIHTIAQFLKTTEPHFLDWLENLSVVQVDQALVVNYFLRSTRSKDQLVLRGSVVPESPLKKVVLCSTRAIWPMAEPWEQEAEELFGIAFRSDFTQKEIGVRRQILPEGWVGFPMRKEYVFPQEVYGIPHRRAKLKPEPNPQDPNESDFSSSGDPHARSTSLSAHTKKDMGS